MLAPSCKQTTNLRFTFFLQPGFLIVWFLWHNFLDGFLNGTNGTCFICLSQIDSANLRFTARVSNTVFFVLQIGTCKSSRVFYIDTENTWSVIWDLKTRGDCESPRVFFCVTKRHVLFYVSNQHVFLSHKSTRDFHVTN